MTNVPSSGPKGDPAAVAAYVAAIAGELSRLARANGLGTLAYILEMAQLEAKGLADESRAPSGGDANPRREGGGG